MSAPTMTRPAVKMASEKQAQFAYNLWTARRHTDAVMAAFKGEYPGAENDPTGSGITAAAARFLIDELINQPWEEAAAPAWTKVGPGYYRAKDLSVIKVVKNKTNDRHSGRRLVPASGKNWKWIYEPGLLDEAAAGHLVTVEEAAAYGREHEMCLICGTGLDVQASRERGIGPTCYRNLRAQATAAAAAA